MTVVEGLEIAAQVVGTASAVSVLIPAKIARWIPLVKKVIDVIALNWPRKDNSKSTGG